MTGHIKHHLARRWVNNVFKPGRRACPACDREGDWGEQFERVSGTQKTGEVKLRCRKCGVVFLEDWESKRVGYGTMHTLKGIREVVE